MSVRFCLLHRAIVLFQTLLPRVSIVSYQCLFAMLLTHFSPIMGHFCRITLKLWYGFHGVHFWQPYHLFGGISTTCRNLIKESCLGG